MPGTALTDSSWLKLNFEIAIILSIHWCKFTFTKMMF